MGIKQIQFGGIEIWIVGAQPLSLSLEYTSLQSSDIILEIEFNKKIYIYMNTFIDIGPIEDISRCA